MSDNLIPFKKGHKKVGGKKKGHKSLTAQIKKMLKHKFTHTDPISEQKESKTIAEHIVNALLAKAISGEDKSIKEVLDRIEGRPVHQIDGNITGNMKFTFNTSKTETDNPDDAKD